MGGWVRFWFHRERDRIDEDMRFSIIWSSNSRYKFTTLNFGSKIKKSIYKHMKISQMCLHQNFNHYNTEKLVSSQ